MFIVPSQKFVFRFERQRETYFKTTIFMIDSVSVRKKSKLFYLRKNRGNTDGPLKGF